MDNTKFKDVLKSYETKVEDVNYESLEKSQDELSVISNDVKRTIFVALSKNEKLKEKYLLLILNDLLTSIPTSYVQGMSELCSVFVYYYFSHDFDKFQDQIDLKDENCGEEIELNLEESNYKKFRKFFSKKFEKVRVVITNVIIRKFDPLVRDDFKLYKEYNSVFVAMLNKRNIRIKEMEAYMYMGSLLTFFYRDITSIEDAYKMFEIILSCPPSSLFLLLVIYFDTISNKKLIRSVDDNLYKSVILLEDEFIKLQESLQNNSGCFLSRHAVLIGGVIGFAVAVAAYKINKKASD